MVGKTMANWTIEVAESARWKFREAGWTDKQYDELLVGMEEELSTKPGIFVPYWLTYATKI
jgi:hypothetical protein